MRLMIFSGIRNEDGFIDDQYHELEMIESIEERLFRALEGLLLEGSRQFGDMSSPHFSREAIAHILLKRDTNIYCRY